MRGIDPFRCSECCAYCAPRRAFSGSCGLPRGVTTFSFRLCRDGRRDCHGFAYYDCWFSDPVECPIREARRSSWVLRHMVARLGAVQFVPTCEAYPAVHFAGRRPVASIKLFAQPMKVVLSQSFRFVQQRADDLASGGGVPNFPDVVGNDSKVWIWPYWWRRP